jgi:hypothetical protein
MLKTTELKRINMFTHNKRSKRIMIPSLILALMMLAVSFGPAFAAGDENCWGTVTSQRASTVHDIGEHSSSQGEPRLGLGNVARLFGFDSVGALGSFLASVDELDATQCP